MACFSALSRLPPIDLTTAQTNVATETWDVGAARQVRFSDSIVTDVCYLDAKDRSLPTRLKDFAAQDTFTVYANASFQRIAIGSEQGVVVVDRVTDEQSFHNLIGIFEGKKIYEAHENSVWRSDLITLCDPFTLHRLEFLKIPFQGNDQPMWLTLAYGQFMFTFPTVICQVCVDALEAAALRLAVVEAQPPKRRTTRSAPGGRAPPAPISPPVLELCPLCGYTCGSWREKSVHALRQHFFDQLSPSERWFDERSPTCPFCGSYLANGEAMVEHMLDQHQADVCLKMRWQPQDSIRIQDIERVIGIITGTPENRPAFNMLPDMSQMAFNTFPDMDQMAFVPQTTNFEPVGDFARIDDAAPTKPVTRTRQQRKPAAPNTSVAEESWHNRQVPEEAPAIKTQARHLVPEPPIATELPPTKVQARHLVPEPPIAIEPPLAKVQARHLVPEPPIATELPPTRTQARHVAPEAIATELPPAKVQARHVAPEAIATELPPAKVQARRVAPEAITAKPPAEYPGNFMPVPQSIDDGPPGFEQQNVPTEEEDPDDAIYVNSIASSIRTRGLDVSNSDVQIGAISPVNVARAHAPVDDDVTIPKSAWAMLDCLEQKLTILGKISTEPVCECHICRKSCRSYIKLLQHCWNHHREYLKAPV